MNMTTEISGCDAERLADCIKRAAEEGLSITKDTQAGVNRSSGNVWLWDEDWPVCVYEGISDDDASLMWTCPNCGDEVDCDDVNDAETLNEKYNEIDGCTACKQEE